MGGLGCWLACLPLHAGCEGETRVWPCPGVRCLHMPQVHFSQPRPRPHAHPQMWCCSPAHKKQVLMDILSGLPYRTSSRCTRGTTAR